MSDNAAHLLFDRPLQRLRLRRALARPDGYVDFLLARATADLEERLSAVTRRFPLALDLGTPTGMAAESLRGSGQVDHVVRAASLVEDQQRPHTARLPHARIVADEEALPFGPASFDLAVSLLALHGVNDLPGTLVQIRRALKADGLFMACLLGGASLTELRQSLLAAEIEMTGGASPRIAPFADIRDLGALLQRAGFALPVADIEPVTVRYPHLFALLGDLRGMGWGNSLLARRRGGIGRAVLARCAEIYAQRFADRDGRLRCTIEMVWLSGWVPHDSQQKPLLPGSAQTRLAAALGVSEQKL